MLAFGYQTVDVASAAVYTARWDEDELDYVNVTEMTSFTSPAGNPSLIGTVATGIDMYYTAAGRQGLLEISVSTCMVSQ
jgi:hypothetical protein